ncbi:PP2C family protein-serine/threonine phosphatase [Streptomyces thermogriseus]|uniref:PP2C family protein-serine/threonine phosphatase n=1 Tax=Streptomyces thermogriseus TaxID=75292 RepID=A0ABN1SW86_9ACTN
MRHHRTYPIGPRSWPVFLPALAIVASVVLGLFTPHVNTFPLLAAAPLLAAPVLSLPGTVVTGVVAIVVGQAKALLVSGGSFFAYGVQLSSMVVLTVLASVLNRMMSRYRKELKDAREVAEAVQRAVLPTPPARIGPLDVAVRYQAAMREAAIGGDFYAIHSTPHGIRLMIADVRGKGVGAVKTVNGLLGSFHEAATRVPDLPGVVAWLEERMRELNSEDTEGEESFATAVVIEIPADGCVLRLVNLGHCPPLLVHRGRARLLTPAEPALPLGLGDLGRERVPVEQHPLPPGATLVLYTDGVVEARDRRGVFYDPVPSLSRPLPTDPDAILDTLLADLARHTGGRLDDDAALMAVTHRQEAQGGPALSTGRQPSRTRPLAPAPRASRVAGPEGGLMGKARPEGIRPGFRPSRFRDSNPRPTHYECVALAI